jgi:hypothetical protein
MKTMEQDNALNAILTAAIAEAQSAGDDVKIAAEAAAKAFVAGLVAAESVVESVELVVSTTGQVERRPPS